MPERDEDTLVAELRALGERLDVPEPADQRAAVRARLSRPRSARSRLLLPDLGRPRARRWIVALVAAILGAVAVVPPARAAVADAVGGILRIAGIEVRREPTPGLPARPGPLPSVRSAELDEARRVALFPVRAPAALGPPDQVLLADPDATGAPRVITLSYRSGAVRFEQFDGTLEMAFFKSAPDAQWVQIGTNSGIWLPGPHPVTYIGRDGVERTETARLAGPTLIWADAAVTYRLEGLPTLAEAQAAADSVT